MKQDSSYYVYGSSAPEIQQGYVTPLRLPEELAPAPVEDPKTRRRQQRREAQKRNLLFKFQLIVCAMLFFAGCLVLMVGYSVVGVQQKNIDQLSRNLQDFQKKNATIEGEISRNMDLHALEEKAIGELGMVRPTEHQMISIQVPQSSYTIRHVPVQPRQAKGSFLSFVQILIKGW